MEEKKPKDTPVLPKSDKQTLDEVFLTPRTPSWEM